MSNHFIGEKDVDVRVRYAIICWIKFCVL